MNKENKQRLLELDSLRGIMCLCVMIFHYTTRYQELFGHRIKYPIEFPYGKFGVQFFLITSGFLIFYIKVPKFSLKNFLFKKVIRLYPAYIVGIIITYIVLNIYPLEGRTVDLNTFLFNLTMLQGFFQVPYVDSAHWYLTVELIFVIWSSILLFFIKKYANFNTDKALALFVILSIAIRLVNTFIPINRLIRLLLLTEYAPYFIIGILLSIKEKENSRFNKVIMILCMISIIMSRDIGLFVVTSIIIIIFKLMLNNKIKFINNKVFLFIGSISYSLYLIHQNIGYAIINKIENSGIFTELGLLIPALISIFLATIITYLFEKPLLKYLKKYK